MYGVISVMDDLFKIDIVYQGDVVEFEVRLVSAGYLHKFYVTVCKEEVIFEPDEERNYRAIVIEDSIKDLTDKDNEIIRLIAEKLCVAKLT